MSPPVFLPTRSRALISSCEAVGDVARYVPAFDGQIRFTNDTVPDSTIWIAEGAHRFMSLSTNIGAVDFALEAMAARLTGTLRYHRDPRVILQIIIWLKNLHPVLERLFKSYEALDESWSAFVLYLNLLRDGRNSDAKVLERHLQAYDRPSILRRFQELKRLRNGFWNTDIGEDLALRALMYSALIPPRNYKSWFQGDKRLKFFIASAERWARRRKSLKEIQSDIVAESHILGIPLVDVNLDPAEVAQDIDVMTIHGYLSKEFYQMSLKSSLTIFERRNELHESGSAGLNPMIVTESPLILLTPSKDRFKLNIRKDLNKNDALPWAELLCYSFILNAVLSGKENCPLNMIEADGVPICPPEADKRCLYRLYRELFTIGDFDKLNSVFHAMQKPGIEFSPICTDILD